MIAPPFAREGGFGDNWHLCNYALRLSEAKPDFDIMIHTRKRRVLNLMSMFKPLLKTSGNFGLAQDFKTGDLLHTNFPGWNKLYDTKLLPTIKQWKEKPNNKNICYQFDGLADVEKNPSEYEKYYFFEICNKLGYKTIDLGSHKPMPYIIEHLTNAKLFVGCMSGMSIICQSTNTPMLLFYSKLSESKIQRIKRDHYSHYESITWFGSLIDVSNHLLETSIL